MRPSLRQAPCAGTAMQMQASMAAVLDHLPVGVVLIDPAGRIRHVNRAALAIVSELDVDKVLQLIVDSACELIGTKYAALAVGALVFIAPLPSMDHGLRQFALRARVPLDVMDRAARRIEADLGFRRTVMDLVELAQRNQAPLLCLHDVDDRVTPVEASREIVRSWPAARILETRGLGHRRILRDPAVIEHAVAFLAQGHQERPRDLERALAAQCALEA